MKAKLPDNEVQRLATLHGYEVLDTLSEQAFDDLTMLAAQICQTPIALVSLIDEKRQWFKSNIGLNAAETSREFAFCAHAILNPQDVLEVHDAQLDPRFVDNPLVTGDPNIRFYAGMPLVAADDSALGTLCVIDREPRKLSEAQKLSLQSLGRHVVSLLELRRSLIEQQHVEKALRESEERFHDLLEHAHNLILSVRPDGSMLYANRALRVTLGYSEAEMAGLSLQGIIHPSSFSRCMAMFQEVLAGKTVEQVEAVFQTKDGRTITVVGNSNCHFVDGKPVATRSIFHDISGLKRAEKERDLMFNCALDLYGIANFNGYFIQLNPAWEKTLGWSVAEVLARPYLELVHPDDREATANAAGSLVDGRTIYHLDNRYLCKDGSYKWFSWVAYPQTEEGLIFAIARDVTESKRAEKEIKQLNESLEHRAEELKRSNTELEQFAYIASHDLQEPLRMVSSYTQLLAKRYQGRLDKEADEFIAFAVDGAARMQRLIQNLLAYSRVGMRGQEMAPIESGQCLENALANLKVVLEESHAAVTHERLPSVHADASQLTQLLQNLIGNAIKFHGGQTPEIHLSVKRDGQQWRFSVRDNGIGIEPKYQERIFVIFQRLHAREAYPGTGIGLALCKKIVQRHGGRIWVESNPDAGSTFYFTLPARETAFDGHG